MIEFIYICSICMAEMLHNGVLSGHLFQNPDGLLKRENVKNVYTMEISISSNWGVSPLCIEKLLLNILLHWHGMIFD